MCQMWLCFTRVAAVITIFAVGAVYMYYCLYMESVIDGMMILIVVYMIHDPSVCGFKLWNSFTRYGKSSR